MLKRAFPTNKIIFDGINFFKFVSQNVSDQSQPRAFPLTDHLAAITTNKDHKFVFAYFSSTTSTSAPQWMSLPIPNGAPPPPPPVLPLPTPATPPGPPPLLPLGPRRGVGWRGQHRACLVQARPQDPRPPRPRRRLQQLPLPRPLLCLRLPHSLP